MVKRILTLSLVLGLLAGSMTLPAEAKKKKAAKPVATTLYLHGTQPFGEMESFAGTTDVNTYLPMDTEEPSGGPRSKQLTNYVRGPNTECAGNNLFPVWTGPFVGTVTGDIKVSFDVVSSPGAQVDVRIWADVASQLCTNATLGIDDYVEPNASAVISLPAGSGVAEVEIPGVNFKAMNNLMLQITPVLDTPFFGRVFYDVEASKIELTCIPASGKKTCA